MPSITPMDGSMWKLSGFIFDTDPKRVMDKLIGMLKASGFSILNTADHHFEPEGYTSLVLLGESHLAVHTFPEAHNSYFELSSCVEAKYDAFRDLLQKESPSYVDISTEEVVRPPLHRKAA